jgi:hypothetical protein
MSATTVYFVDSSNRSAREDARLTDNSPPIVLVFPFPTINEAVGTSVRAYALIVHIQLGAFESPTHTRIFFFLFHSYQIVLNTDHVHHIL